MLEIKFFFKLFNFPVLIAIVFQILIVLVNSENTLKVCTKKGQVHEVSTGKCSKGAWTSDIVDVDCVCVNGLWVLSEKFCDKDFYVIASKENECFKINRHIRRFLSLMNNDDLNSGELMYFKGNLESFRKFKGSMSVQSTVDSSYIIRYNDTEHPVYLKHEEGVTSKFWQKCYDPVEELESFQIIKSDSVSYVSASNTCDKLRDLKFGYGTTEKSTWNLDMGSSWHSKYGLEKFSESCMKSCGPLKATQQQGRGITKTSTNSSEEDDNNKIEDSREDNVEEVVYDLNVEEGDKGEDKDVLAEKLADNGRDTMRIIHYLKKWIFHQKAGPKVPYKEYKYLQLARIIFLKSCPEVDGSTLTNFIRLFRFLIHEALKKTPDKYPSTTDKRVHKRIVETLRKCFGSVTPYKLEFDDNVCDNSVNILSITDAKGTKYSPTINGSDTDELEFKTGTDSDTVLETAWKIMLHAHYQCAQDFQEHPDDLSVMYVKLQEFLVNPHIIFRWENPGDYLNKVYGFMHPGFKLEKFAKTVDACVNAAKESSFFKEWLRRPKDEQDFRKDSVMGRSMVLFGATGQDTPTLFNGKGYCVNKFEDPQTWTKFNTAVNAECQ